MKSLLLVAALVLSSDRYVANHVVDPSDPGQKVLTFTCVANHPYLGNSIWFYHAGEQAADWVVIDNQTPDDCKLSLLSTNWPGGQHFIRVEQRNANDVLIASGTVGFWITAEGAPAPATDPERRPQRPSFTVLP
ncbi:MAG: hypothetical protein U9Q19_05420 [Pseudomonadota bacterium]|nr:hypothetical protein [Pseudomonadota bacterium]